MILIKRFLFLILSLLILATGPALLYLQNYLEPMWNMKYAIMIQSDVNRGEMITGDQVTIKKVPIDLLLDSALTGNSEDEIVLALLGQVPMDWRSGLSTYFDNHKIQANRDMKKNEQLITDNFNTKKWYPTKDEIIFPLSNNWVVSKPNDLSSGDQVRIIPFVHGGTLPNDPTTGVPQATKEKLMSEIVVAGVKDVKSDNKSANVQKIIELIVNEQQREVLLHILEQGNQIIIAKR